MRLNRGARLLGGLGSVLILVMGMGLLAVSQTTTTPQQPGSLPTPPEIQNSAPPPSPAPLIMIDAAHGGAESGAVLGPDNLEKTVTLAFARRLRQDLMSRGLQAQLVRDGDTLLSTDQRATIANASRPSLYICIHATSQGSGLRVYTGMLPFSNDDRGPFVSWPRAQRASLSRSRSLQQQLTAAIQTTRFPVRSLTAPLRPLNNIVVPAVAIEIAPASGEASQLATTDYQQMISAVLANAIAALKSTLESGR